jgi:hypothetical protein
MPAVPHPIQVLPSQKNFTSSHEEYRIASTPSVLEDLLVLNAELYVCRPSAVKTNLLMSKQAVNRTVTEKQAGQSNALRQRIRLLGIVAVVVISSIVSRIHAPSGQEQGRTWKAIGAIYQGSRTVEKRSSFPIKVPSGKFLAKAARCIA